MGKANRDELHWTTLRDKSELANLKQIKPLTSGQQKYFEAVAKNKVTLVSGWAGTGKSFVVCGIAAQMLRAKKIEKIILSRPLVSCGQEYGFRPGTVLEKVIPVMTPLIDALSEFLGVACVKKFIEQEIIQLWPLQDMRGASIKNTFLILDEAQNATYEQLFMFLTRFSSGSKVVVCGDIAQSDFVGNQRNPYKEVMLRLQKVKDIGQVFLTKEDIVRDPLTKIIHDRLVEEHGIETLLESWYKDVCPKCKNVVWYSNGNECDLTVSDVEAIKCWSCDQFLCIPDEVDQPLWPGFVDDRYWVESYPRPK